VLIHYTLKLKGKVRYLVERFLHESDSVTRNQERFTISEVAAAWHATVTVSVWVSICPYRSRDTNTDGRHHLHHCRSQTGITITTSWPDYPYQLSYRSKSTEISLIRSVVLFLRGQLFFKVFFRYSSPRAKKTKPSSGKYVSMHCRVVHYIEMKRLVSLRSSATTHYSTSIHYSAQQISQFSGLASLSWRRRSCIFTEFRIPVKNVRM